jgi:MFS family permease
MKQKRDDIEKLKTRTRKLSVKEGSAYSVMDGFGLRYISPYALYLGATNKQIGMLSSISVLLSHLSQLFTLKALKHTTRKKLLVGGTFLQAISWILVLIIGIIYTSQRMDSFVSSNMLIFAYALIILFGGFVHPAWISLMKDNLSKKENGRYFGRRNRIVGIVTLISFIAGGFVLDYFSEFSLLTGFLILFSVAMVARLISSYLLTKHYEPELRIRKENYFSFYDFIKRLPKSNFAKFSVFVALIMFATSIASPFFSVYMLKELHFSYRFWMFVIVSSSVGSFLFMPIWGKFSDKHGNYISIKIAGMLIPWVPLLWILAPWVLSNFGMNSLIIYFVCVEAFSGIAWAGFNLSVFNYIYDAVSRKKLILCTIYFNLLSGVGVFVGAILGGFISSMNSVAIFGSSILFVFLLSGILRLTIYLFFINHIKEVRKIRKKDHFEMRAFVREKFLGISHHNTRPKPTH